MSYVLLLTLLGLFVLCDCGIRRAAWPTCSAPCDVACAEHISCIHEGDAQCFCQDGTQPVLAE